MLLSREELTLKLARAIFAHDRKRGLLYWKVATSRVMIPGSVAGCLNSKGYIQIQLFGKSYKAHNLIWFTAKGAWPKNELDHKNGRRNDNRLRNLRECTDEEQNLNRRILPSNKSGFPNVHWNKERCRWCVQIRNHKKNVFVGNFEKFSDACSASKRAKATHHKFQPTHRGVGK